MFLPNNGGQSGFPRCHIVEGGIVPSVVADAEQGNLRHLALLHGIDEDGLRVLQILFEHRVVVDAAMDDEVRVGREIITSALWRSKKVSTKSIYTGSRAEQDMNGTMSIVSTRSFGFCMSRAAMIAGTLQPKPMSIGTKLRP